jgi:1,4-alpha-glucan branching enzyme
LDEYHADGLRVDAVASMLYLDYSRKKGEWIANEHGGRENLEAIRFLRELNEVVYRYYPDVHTIAEESTDWPMVSRPTYVGGLGFGMKWDMGWMHDTLQYFRRDPIYRPYHHDQLTFRMIYAFNENFMLSLSHDEVVHGKSSLPGKMPADDWQKFANLRSLFAYMFAQPGKKLMFMGMEFGQWEEWNHEGSIHWHALDYQPHRGLAQLVRDLNLAYRRWPSLYEQDFDPHGFRWVDASDYQHSVFSYLRKSRDEKDLTLVVMNLTPQVHYNYRIGVPRAGVWHEVINTDGEVYAGSGVGNGGQVQSVPVKTHGFADSLELTLPPLAVMYFHSHEGTEDPT